MASYQENKSFISEVISTNLLDDAVSFIRSRMYPEDVFEHDKLEAWALENGYVKQDN